MCTSRTNKRLTTFVSLVLLFSHCTYYELLCFHILSLMMISICKTRWFQQPIHSPQLCIHYKRLDVTSLYWLTKLSFLFWPWKYNIGTPLLSASITQAFVLSCLNFFTVTLPWHIFSLNKMQQLARFLPGSAPSQVKSSSKFKVDFKILLSTTWLNFNQHFQVIKPDTPEQSIGSTLKSKANCSLASRLRAISSSYLISWVYCFKLNLGWLFYNL